MTSSARPSAAPLREDLIGACGPVCAAAGPVAVGVLTGGIGGAVGNATGQLIDLAIEKKPISEFDWQEFGVETSASVIFGAIPLGGKGGRGALKALKSNKAVSPTGVIPFAAPVLSSKQSFKTNARILWPEAFRQRKALFRKGLAEAAPGVPRSISTFAIGQNLFSWGFRQLAERRSQPRTTPLVTPLSPLPMTA